MTMQEGAKELEKLVHLALCDSSDMCHLLSTWRKSFQQTLGNFCVVSKHVSGKAWTLEETSIFSTHNFKENN